MQIMHDRPAPQITHILPDATVVDAATLPTATVRQRVFSSHTLPQLRLSLRCLLTFPQLLQQGFIRMNTGAAARRARGATFLKRLASLDGRGKLHDSPRHKGPDLSTWTPQGVPFPIQVEYAFKKIRTWTYWPAKMARASLRCYPSFLDTYAQLMCNAGSVCWYAARLVSLVSVMLASGALAGMTDTATITTRRESRACSPWRLEPSPSRRQSLRPWRLSASSTPMRRSAAMPQSQDSIQSGHNV